MIVKYFEVNDGLVHKVLRTTLLPGQGVASVQAMCGLRSVHPPEWRRSIGRKPMCAACSRTQMKMFGRSTA